MFGGLRVLGFFVKLTRVVLVLFWITNLVILEGSISIFLGGIHHPRKLNSASLMDK